MRTSFLAAVTCVCLMPGILLAQGEEPPFPDETAAEAAEETPAGPEEGQPEEQPEIRRVALDRDLSVSTLGMSYRIANDWTVRHDELAARRVFAQGPIEFGLQTTLNIWIISNGTVFGEFLKQFETFLGASYPTFSRSATVETSVSGYRAATVRLEGILSGEGEISVSCVYGFTVLDLDQYKLIIMLVWPKAENDYYLRFQETFLSSVTLSGSVMYQRMDGYVEAGKYLFKPLPDWSASFVRKSATDDRSVDKVILSAPTGAKIEYLLEEKNEYDPLSVHVRRSYENNKQKGDVTYEKIHEGLYKMTVDLELATGNYRILAFYSGHTGELLVAKTTLRKEEWAQLGKYAEEMGRAFALKSAPTSLVPPESAGGDSEKTGPE